MSFYEKESVLSNEEHLVDNLINYGASIKPSGPLSASWSELLDSYDVIINVDSENVEDVIDDINYYLTRKYNIEKGFSVDDRNGKKVLVLPVEYLRYPYLYFRLAEEFRNEFEAVLVDEKNRKHSLTDDYIYYVSDFFDDVKKEKNVLEFHPIWNEILDYIEASGVKLRA